jgi:hypothetical protein
MGSVTVDQVLSWHPCSEYTRERVTELFAGHDTVTVADILNMDIPPQDKLWAALHREFFTDERLHNLACDFAEHVVHLCGDDPRPQAAIDAKRAWLRGEITDEELTAARDAAWDASWVAAGAATWNVTWASAGTTASAAASATASAAASAAAWVAAWAAREAAKEARDAALAISITALVTEAEWQLEQVRSSLPRS